MKSAFDPTGIKEFLPFITLHERLGRYEMRGRLTGTEIDSTFSVNYTDQNLYDLYDPDLREFFAELHDNTLGIPCGTQIERIFEMFEDRYFRIDSTHVPLANNEGEAVYILSLVQPQPEFAAGPKAGQSKTSPEANIDITYLDLGFGIPPDQK